MIVNAGPFRWEMNLDQEVTRVAALPARLADARETVLSAMGVQAASWAIQDYRARSAGASAGGIAWKPITPSAIKTRLAGRTPWQRLSQEKKAVAESLKAAKANKKSGFAAIKGKRTKDAVSQRKALRKAYASAQKQAKNKRASIKKKREAMFSKESGSSKIGVDTGRLVNSLVYGVPALSSVKVGIRPSTNADLTPGIFALEGDSLRLGSVMKYAGYFDEIRPIFPEGFIDEARKKQLDDLADKALNAFIEKGGK